ncbi:MAG: hypothetical protein US70_C0038G0002 [Parcubacteria group bacterium GW2011_GWD2_38_11]|nr:MAG: hypothetical protein US70_C0038G0002 [Parcubacteria group bacterium GW2011_GWD2_38_11]
MPHPKMYADAQEKIEKILSEMKTEHSYSLAETFYKIIRVEEELLILEIHNALKELVQEQYNLVGSGHNEIKFIKKEDNQWELIIESGGVESHFFARLLEMVSKKLNEGKNDRINEGKEVIKSTFEKVMLEVDLSRKYPTRIWYKKGMYYILIRTNGTKLTFQNKYPKRLAEEIKDKLPGFIEALTKK